MKDVLDDFGEDPVKLAQLLTGHRIKLAEDLSQYSFFPIIHIVSQHHSDHNLQQKLNDSDVLLDEYCVTISHLYGCIHNLQCRLSIGL